MANFVSYSDATALFTEVGNKLKALAGAYVIKGNSAFASLPTSLTKTMSGYVYNVTDQFTTTSLFVEGAGKKYPAGTNVVVVNLGTDSTPDMKYDVIGAFVDVDAINNSINAVSESITTGSFDATQAYAVGDIVKKDFLLYKFKAAHTANDPWDASEVDAVTVLDLIAAHDPASLTTEQQNALIALLS